jgi:hypothetical protein
MTHHTKWHKNKIIFSHKVTTGSTKTRATRIKM